MIAHRSTRNLICTLLTLIGVVALGGCGSQTHESIAEEIMDSMEHAMTTLAEMETEDDLADAEETLSDVATRVKALAADFKALGEPTPEAQKRIEEMMEERESRIEEIMATPPPLVEKNPAVMMELSKSLEEIGEAFTDLR